jgi:hypothetical protein
LLFFLFLVLFSTTTTTTLTEASTLGFTAATTSLSVARGQLSVTCLGDAAYTIGGLFRSFLLHFSLQTFFSTFTLSFYSRFSPCSLQAWITVAATPHKPVWIFGTSPRTPS